MRELALWLPCNEAHGPLWNDLSGRGNNATVTNYSSASWIGGNYGPAVQFNGSTQYASVNPETVTGTFTTAFWMYINVITGQHVLVGADPNSFDYHILISSGRFYVRTTSGTAQQTGTIASNYVGGWHHFLAERGTDNKINVEIDRVRVTSGTSVITGSVSVDTLGARTAGVGLHYDGGLRDIRVYDRTLEAAEKDILYRGDLTPLRVIESPAWAFDIAAAGGSVTVSLDSILQKQGLTAVASFDAAVQQAQQIQANLDAVLLQAQAVATDFDAKLQGSLAQTTDFDAKLQAAQARTTGLDATLAKSQSSTTSIDTVLKQAQSLSASLDAALRAAQARTVLFDAHLTQEGSGVLQVAMDAALKGSLSLSTSIDAALQQAQSSSISMDSVLLASQATTTSLDAILQAISQQVTTSIDTVLQQSQTLSTLFDAILLSGLTFGIDAIIKRTGLSLTYVMDAVLQSGCQHLTDPEIAASVISALTDPESAATTISLSDPETTAKPFC